MSSLASVSSDFDLQPVSKGELIELWPLAAAVAIREKTVQDLCILIDWKACLFLFAQSLNAALFICFVLVYLPGRFLSWSGIVAPATTGAPQVAGMILVFIGTVIALWCVFTFVFIGKGTPAPFDPPRKLVIRGPYRFVRNPMYIGAGMTLAGAALYYQSLSILIYAGAFFLITHLFVVLYEEPTLRRTFGSDYEAYFRRVRRWWPTKSKK